MRSSQLVEINTFITLLLFKFHYAVSFNLIVKNECKIDMHRLCLYSIFAADYPFEKVRKDVRHHVNKYHLRLWLQNPQIGQKFYNNEKCNYNN